MAFAGEYVTTGDVITTGDGFLRGHGTMIEDHGDEKRLVATVSGFIERVNKLISIKPLNVRYYPDIGDVVVGRIADIQAGQWRVNISTRQHAQLKLAAIQLPGGEQRRRTQSDSLQMRIYFQEGELISAEVQKVRSDGQCTIQARNIKYGKLQNGMLLQVPASLMKRQKTHFHSLPPPAEGVNIILGMNGYIWITETPAKPESGYDPTKDVNRYKRKRRKISATSREKIARVRNSILAITSMSLPIYTDIIMDVYRASLDLMVPAKSLLNPEVLQRVTQSAVERAREAAHKMRQIKSHAVHANTHIFNRKKKDEDVDDEGDEESENEGGDNVTPDEKPDDGDDDATPDDKRDDDATPEMRSIHDDPLSRPLSTSRGASGSDRDQMVDNDSEDDPLPRKGQFGYDPLNRALPTERNQPGSDRDQMVDNDGEYDPLPRKGQFGYDPLNRALSTGRDEPGSDRDQMVDNDSEDDPLYGND